MKVLKKLTALLLCAACLCALLVAPASSATVSTFTDITDPAVGQAVEALRTMGVIDGVGPTSYAPESDLTRAQFCKLAVVAMGRGSEVAAYANRTIFPDVASGHWARGFVNLAASITVGEGGSRLIMGVGDGTFAPDRAITYGEAVTILLRILGYGAQANINWPYGAMTTAATIGLTGGVSTTGANSTINRGNAAILFYNLLNTPTNGSNSIFAATLGSVEPGTLLVSCNTTAENGKSGAVKLLTGSGEVVRLAAVGLPASFLQGARGTAVFNGDGLFLTFLPDKGMTSRTIVTAKATAGTNGVMTASDGSQITVPASAAVWYNGQRRTYNEVYAVLNRAGVTVTVYYTAAGAVDYLYVGGVVSSNGGNVMAAKDPITGNPFAGITGGNTGYAILKNGVAATASDLRQYDVGAFDAATNTLFVTDFRLTGVYQAATPNLAAPSKIKVFNQEFEVLDCAIDDLQAFKLGDTFTLLFAPDGKVAGVVSASQTRSTAVGTVDPNSSDGNVTVHLLGAPSDKLATVSGSCTGVDSYKDSLVSVSAGSGSVIYLTRLTGGTAAAPLNVGARTIGGDVLADNVSVYERVGGSSISAISLADVTVDTVAAAKIVYMRKNYANKIDLLVLDDVTGDRYTYGIASTGLKEGGWGELSYSNVITTVTNGKSSLTTIGGANFQDGQFIGLVPSLSTLDGENRMAGSLVLKSVSNVSAGNFNMNTLRFFSGSVELPIWDQVQCYNAQTKTWFTGGDTPLDDLNTCLAYSNSLTVYYDRDPNQGGKVRIVVAN